jgi:hypothetical protein
MAGERKAVFTMTEREVNGEKKTFWTRVGVAFVNRDGSITIKLDALPLSGTLQVREEDREYQERKRAAGLAPVPASSSPAHADDAPF